MTNGPKNFSFIELHDEKFEELAFLLAHIEFPDLVKTGNPDGGLDAYIPGDGVTPCLRGFQAKRFSRGVGWKKCEKSLDDAVAAFAVRHVTFVFANNLTVGQRKNFESRLATRHPGVKVDHWGAGQLTAKLIGSERGRQVARHVFGEERLDHLERSIRAQRDLNTGGQAIEVLGAAGEKLADDPYYLYAAGTRPSSVPGAAPPEDAIMRLEIFDQEQTKYLDALPRPAARAAGLQPRAHFVLPDEEARKNFERFLTGGGELAVKGVRIETAELPKYFEELIGEISEGDVTFVAPPAPEIIVEVNTDQGLSELEFTIRRVPAEPGWDGKFEARRNGMTLTLELRHSGATGEINVNWAWTTSEERTVSERLEALRFMEAMSGSGTFHVRDKRTGNLVIDQRSPETPLENEAQALIGIFEDIITLEKWVGQDIAVPNTFELSDVQQLRRIAMLIEGWEHDWNRVTMTLIKEHDPKQIEAGVDLLIGEDFSVEIFGRTFELGRVQNTISTYEIVSSEPATKGATRYVLGPKDDSKILSRLVPADADPPA